MTTLYPPDPNYFAPTPEIEALARQYTKHPLKHYRRQGDYLTFITTNGEKWTILDPTAPPISAAEESTPPKPKKGGRTK